MFGLPYKTRIKNHPIIKKLDDVQKKKGQMLSLGQKLKLIKTGQNRNDSTLELVFTKKRPQKLVIFEK